MEDINELNGPKIIPLVDPTTGEELKLTKDGTFQNLRTKEEFFVNERGFITSINNQPPKEKPQIQKPKSQVPKQTITKKQTFQQQITPKPQVKQIPLEVIYKDYVNRYLNLVYKEKGVLLEFAFNKENTYCTSSALSNNKIIYQTNFQNIDKFKNNVILTIVDEFIKNSEEVIYNENDNNLTLKNKDTDEIRFINGKEDLLNKIKEYEIIEYDEKLELFKFYLVTITITILIILCVLGIVLVLG